MTRALRLLALALAATFTSGCAVEGDLDDDIEGEDSEDVTEALKDKNAYKLKVITHNIAGGMISEGDLAAVDYAVAEANGYKPDVMLLSEICESQATSLKEKLGGTWTVHYEKSYPHPKCGSLGLAVASRHPMSAPSVITLPDPFPKTDEKDYKALCANVSITGRKGFVHACSTHLISTGKDKTLRDETEKARARQVIKLVDGVKGHLKGNDPVVIAGDFNAGPSRELLNPLYRVTLDGKMNGPGDFDEADSTDAKRQQYKDPSVTCAPEMCRSGKPTHDASKLDHIFFSHGRVVGKLVGEVRGKGKSDHNLYRGSAVIKLKASKS